MTDEVHKEDGKDELFVWDKIDRWADWANKPYAQSNDPFMRQPEKESTQEEAIAFLENFFKEWPSKTYGPQASQQYQGHAKPLPAYVRLLRPTKLSPICEGIEELCVSLLGYRYSTRVPYITSHVPIDTIMSVGQCDIFSKSSLHVEVTLKKGS